MSPPQRCQRESNRLSSAPVQVASAHRVNVAVAIRFDLAWGRGETTTSLPRGGLSNE